MPVSVVLSNAPFRIREKPLTPKSISSNGEVNVPSTAIHGVWMGFLKLSSSATSQINGILLEILADPVNRKAGIPHLLQELLKRRHPIRVLYTVGTGWISIASMMWFRQETFDVRCEHVCRLPCDQKTGYEIVLSRLSRRHIFGAIRT